MERGQKKTLPGEPTAGRGRFQEEVKARGGPEAEERVARRPATFGSLGERQEGEHTVAQNKAWVSGAAHRALSSTTAQKDSGSPEREKDTRRAGAAPEAPKDEPRHNGGRRAPRWRPRSSPPAERPTRGAAPLPRHQPARPSAPGRTAPRGPRRPRLRGNRGPARPGPPPAPGGPRGERRCRPTSPRRPRPRGSGFRVPSRSTSGAGVAGSHDRLPCSANRASRFLSLHSLPCTSCHVLAFSPFHPPYWPGAAPPPRCVRCAHSFTALASFNNTLCSQNTANTG